MFYKVMCEDNYEIAWLIERTDFEFLSNLAGVSVKDTWKNLEIKFEAGDIGEEKRYSDFPWYSGSVLIIRENVVLKIRKI